MSDERYIFTLACPNRPGIVAAVSAHLFERGGDITEAHQFDDPETRQFFARLVFRIAGTSRDELATGLSEVLARFGGEWALKATSARPRVLLLASKFDHCLVDLLYRWRIGELEMEVTGVISNHPRQIYAGLDLGGIPFHHLPVRKEAKAEQEAEIWRIVQDTGSEIVVLARYMQILSDDLAAKLGKSCINIHHSFLPSFKGAKPYHQAHVRGVKLIGATAHFVTADLDEGPIIEQDVEHITHSDSPEDLVRKGRDIERRVLARALRLRLDNRVLINGRKTVVFRD